MENVKHREYVETASRKAACSARPFEKGRGRGDRSRLCRRWFTAFHVVDIHCGSQGLPIGSMNAGTGFDLAVVVLGINYDYGN